MRILKIMILTGCCIISSLSSLWAHDKVAADSAYAMEEYDKAIAIYKSLLVQGVHADLYYNIGNCYYKTDSIARAILNYERALLLNPGDADIRFNLDLARTKVVDKIIPESEMFFITWGRNLIDLMSMDAWARMAIVAFVLACIFALCYFFGNQIILRKIGFFGAVLMLLMVILSNVFAQKQYEKLMGRKGAVVMDSSVTVKSTPNDSGTDLFVLHEGTKVEIIDDSMKEWKEIRLADGKIGWLPAKTMEVI